jgi:hypothetical protein
MVQAASVRPELTNRAARIDSSPGVGGRACSCHDARVAGAACASAHRIERSRVVADTKCSLWVEWIGGIGRGVGALCDGSKGNG